MCFIKWQTVNFHHCSCRFSPFCLFWLRKDAQFLPQNDDTVDNRQQQKQQPFHKSMLKYNISKHGFSLFDSYQHNSEVLWQILCL